MSVKEMIEGLKAELDKVAAAADEEVSQAKAQAAEPASPAPVEAPAEGGDDAVAQAVKPLQEKIAALEAKLAEPDSTPFDQQAVDKAVADAKAEMQAQFEKAGEDHQAKEQAAADALDALVAKFKELSSK